MLCLVVHTHKKEDRRLFSVKWKIPSAYTNCLYIQTVFTLKVVNGPDSLSNHKVWKRNYGDNAFDSQKLDFIYEGILSTSVLLSLFLKLV